MVCSGSAKNVGSHQAVGEKDNNQMHVWNVEVYVNAYTECGSIPKLLIKVLLHPLFMTMLLH